MSDSPVYLDFAAATPTDPEVASAMGPYLTEIFGNPSSVHSFGVRAREAVEKSRQIISRFLGAEANEIFFTSSGTESNNLAVIGVAKANEARGRHLITSVMEHPSVLNACRALEKSGFEVTYLPSGKDGLIKPDVFARAIRKNTILASIHLANSEIGVIQPIRELASEASRRGVLFHTDACQAAALLDLNVSKLGVDLLTFNGSKCYGPKGVAVLFVSSPVEIFPILYGGGQERSLRSGTENVAAIIGLAKAVELIAIRRTSDARRIAQLRDTLQEELVKLGVKINVADSPRLPNHLSATVRVDETNIVAALDERGVAVSSGSACSSRSLAESHVLTAIGLDADQANKTIRITLGRLTTEGEIVRAVTVIGQLVSK